MIIMACARGLAGLVFHYFNTNTITRQVKIQPPGPKVVEDLKPLPFLRVKD
jgi:hypothetical protein